MSGLALRAFLLLLTTELCCSARLPFQQSWGFAGFPHRRMSLEEEILSAFSTSSKIERPPQPDVKSLHITSEIANRYAHTTLTSRVANPANVSQEASFSVIIPETAFITGFNMEIDGKVYKAYVKEKEEAKREYAEAVNRGQAAAHVQQSARDSERFSVSVNVEAQSKVTFNLNYEELLQRELGVYRHVININPGQIVPDLTIDVHIKELRNITDLRAKEIQSANEIDTDVAENPNAQVEWISGNEAKLHFKADEKEQKRLEKLRKAGDQGAGIAGQFVIDYDVDRDPSGGQVVVNDGYFVHFFAPADLPPLRKHVLFVLDVSGSMSGRKMEQLQQAMLSILDELKPNDIFNIIEFSYSVTVRHLDEEVKSAVFTPQYGRYYNNFMPESEETTSNNMGENTVPFAATPHYIEKAKAVIKKMTAGGGTNIYDALKTAIKLAKNVSSKLVEENQQKNETDTPRPIIIFLTDGEPTVGETSLHKIQSAVNEFNTDPKATIFSLAFGEGADFQFLKKISLANNGFARHIYEAADAQQQLRHFYRQISSPLLSDVKFIYPPGQVDDQSLTKRIFSNLFQGSEIVIAGRVGPSFNATEVEAIALDGPKRFQIPIPDVKTAPSQSLGSLERLWAYMTIRQLLDEDAIHEMEKRDYYLDTTTIKPNSTTNSSATAKPTPKEQALKIALKTFHLPVHQYSEDARRTSGIGRRPSRPQPIRSVWKFLPIDCGRYSFVCPLTSLVVVKPNGTSDLNTESAAPDANQGPNPPMAFQQSQFAAARPAGLQLAQYGGGGPAGFGGIAHKSAMIMSSPNRIFMSSNNRIISDTSSLQLMPANFFGGFSGQSHRINPAMPMGFPPGGFAPSTPIAATLSVPESSQMDRFDLGTAAQDDMSSEAEEVTTESDATEAALASITWLDSVRQGDEISLKTANGTRILTLSTQNITDTQPCTVDGLGEGECRNLPRCLTDAIRTSLEAYTNQYLCILPGDVAGVCCLPETQSTTETVVEVTTELGTKTEEPTSPTTTQAEQVTEEEHTKLLEEQSTEESNTVTVETETTNNPKTADQTDF